MEQNSASSVVTEVSPPETDEEKRLDAMAQTARKRGVSIKQTRTNGKTSEAEEKPSFIPPAHPAAVLIDSIVNNPDFDIVAGQITPIFKRDIPIPKMKVADLRSYLENELGGGVFVIQVRHNGTDVEDEKHGVLKLTVPVKPIVKTENKEADAVAELAARRKETAEQRRLEAERAELENEREERQKKKNANPALEKELAEVKAKAERLEEQQRQAQLAALAAPKESAVDQLVKLAPLIAALAPIFKREPDRTAEVMERLADKQAAAQKEFMQMTREMHEKTLALMREAKKEDGLTQYLKMEDSLMSRLEKFGAFDKRDEEKNGLKLDPSNIFGSLVTSLLEIGYKLVSDPNTGKGIGDALSAISSQVGRPKAQWTVQDIPKIEAWLNVAKQQAAQMQQPQLPVPASSNPPAEFKPEVTQQIQPIAPVEVKPEPTPQPPHGMATVPPPPVATEELPPTVTPQDKVEDLKESVEMSIRQAILDLQAERPPDSQKWVYDALRGWGPEFLKKFNDCPCWADKEQTQYDITPRLNILKSYCDEKLFNQFVALLAEPKYLELFKFGVTELLTQFNNPEAK